MTTTKVIRIGNVTIRIERKITHKVRRPEAPEIKRIPARI